MPPSRASTATEVDGVIWACYHGDNQRFGMMAVDVGVFIIMKWVHKDVSSINTPCDTGNACYMSLNLVAILRGWSGHRMNLRLKLSITGTTR